MACGLALKRPLELDPYHSPEGGKRPRFSSAHYSPFRPVAPQPTPSNSNSKYENAASSTSQKSSPFSSVGTRLSKEQLQSYLKAEIRSLRRRRLLPHSQQSTSGEYRAPRSPNTTSSDSEGEHQSGRLSPPRSSSDGDKPQFTFKQVHMICERLLREQEERLRDQYESALNSKLAEQYDQFVKFTHDQVYRQIETGPASYLS